MNYAIVAIMAEQAAFQIAWDRKEESWPSQMNDYAVVIHRFERRIDRIRRAMSIISMANVLSSDAVIVVPAVEENYKPFAVLA